jgi:hypothetical protein
MSGIRLGTAAGLAAALLFTAVPAQAQSVKASDPETVAAFLRSQGLTAKVTSADDGDPLIESSLGENQKFSVYFYNCTDNVDCSTMQFYAGYTGSDADVELLNTWNRTKRFGRAYIDSVGDPVMEMDIDLYGHGMSRELFSNNFDFWRALMGEFSDFIYD